MAHSSGNDPLFSNKIFAALLIGALSVMVISTFSSSLFPGAGHGGHGDHAKPAYTIAVAETAGAAEVVVEEGPSLAELLAVADAGRGARQFAKCKSCHTVDEGGNNGTGPNLHAIMGAPVAARDGYRYSAALVEHGGTWSYELMDAWLANPKGTIPGNKMSFAGLRRPDQRADLIAYLRSFSPDAPPLPTVETAVDEAPADVAAEAAEGR